MGLYRCGGGKGLDLGTPIELSGALGTYTAIADVKSCRYEFSDSYTLENPRSSSEGSTFGTEITSGTSVAIPSGTKYLKFRITGTNSTYYAAQVIFE